MQNFTFQYRVPFNNFPAMCNVQVKTIGVTKQATKVVILTELAGNHGASVTNSAEYIASELCQQLNLHPGRIIWLEHYPQDNGREEETYDLITFNWQKNVASDPDWNRVSVAWVNELIK